MVLNKNISNISCIFKDCELLESLSYKTIKNINDYLNKEDNIQYIDSKNINLFNYMNNSIDEAISNDNSENYFQFLKSHWRKSKLKIQIYSYHF